MEFWVWQISGFLFLLAWTYLKISMAGGQVWKPSYLHGTYNITNIASALVGTLEKK